MPRDNNRFFDLQDRASALAREAPRPRGHAPGNGADPNRHAGGGPDCTGPVETAALQVLPSQFLSMLFHFKSFQVSLLDLLSNAVSYQCYFPEVVV